MKDTKNSERSGKSGSLKVKSELELTVRYVETDKSGRVYHANYLIYLDLARTDFLKQRGISYKEIEQQGIFFVVSEVSCSYLKPIGFSDRIRIVTRLEETKKASLVFNYQVYRGDTQVFTGKTRLAAVSQTGKVLKIPDEVLKKIT